MELVVLFAVIVGLFLLLIVAWLLKTFWHESRVDKRFGVSCLKEVLEYRDGARMAELSYKFDGSKEGTVVFIYFQGANWNKPNTLQSLRLNVPQWNSG
ncbi:hypothetical protein [Pedosphaera parvula]|uniref:Uncharacterized protein n=1 Tax=Pedosphaera parvula (strain Ellin514) TaxID=320771 RepID=B9XRH9_PEDPL|nr:hypothetical protein [Pedosphaera parvula]EEF57550.1 hypothetical protein Cflav_PD0600 [Pedosphaera parvula Ellin514]